MSRTVSLTPGSMFRIPSGDLLQVNGHRAHEFPATPVAYKMEAAGQGDIFTFMEWRPTDSRPRPTMGFTLFAPEGLQAGAYVVVEWREPKSACIRRATEEEIISLQAAASPPAAKAATA